MDEDGVTDDLAVGLKTAKGEPVLQLSREIFVEAKAEKHGKNGVASHGIEDSDPGPQEKGEMPAEGAGTVLLSVFGSLNWITVKFLLDSGASECFVDKVFAKRNGLKLTKTKEKLKIHLADGTVRVSSWVVK